jgi:hypothetical protein
MSGPSDSAVEYDWPTMIEDGRFWREAYDNDPAIIYALDQNLKWFVRALSIARPRRADSFGAIPHGIALREITGKRN